jgi:membrane protein
MSNRILKYLLDHSLYHELISFLKRIKFYKGEVSLFRIVKIFIEKITNDEILERANGVSFSFTMAIFPAIIFLFTLTAYIHNFVPVVTQDGIMDFISQLMPESMYTTVAFTIQDIISNTRGGLLTFGALFSLLLATNGMMSLIKAFNSCYSTIEKRSYFKARFTATWLTIMLAFVLFMAIILLIVGQFALDFIMEFQLISLEGFDVFLIIILRFLVMFLVFFIAISFIYYFAPAVHYNWRFFSLGSLIATFSCLLTTYGFSYYITNFGTYNKLYGSIGALIALMVWIYLISNILLVGYEINASIHQAHRTVGDGLD